MVDSNNPFGVPDHLVKNDNPLKQPVIIMFNAFDIKGGIHKAQPNFLPKGNEMNCFKVEVKTSNGFVIVRVFGKNRYLKAVKRNTYVTGELYIHPVQADGKEFNAIDIRLSEGRLELFPGCKTLKIHHTYSHTMRNALPNPVYQGGAIAVY